MAPSCLYATRRIFWAFGTATLVIVTPWIAFGMRSRRFCNFHQWRIWSTNRTRILYRIDHPSGTRKYGNPRRIVQEVGGRIPRVNGLDRALGRTAARESARAPVRGPTEILPTQSLDVKYGARGEPLAVRPRGETPRIYNKT